MAWPSYGGIIVKPGAGTTTLYLPGRCSPLPPSEAFHVQRGAPWDRRQMLAQLIMASMTPAQPRRTTPGDRDQARQLLAEAIAMYRQIGMPKHVDMAEVMLGEV